MLQIDKKLGKVPKVGISASSIPRPCKNFRCSPRLSTHNQIFHFWQMLIVYASTRQNRHRTSVKCDNSFEVKDCVMLIIVSKHCYRKGNAPCNYSVACLLFIYWLTFHGYYEVQPGIGMQKLTWIELNYPCNAQYPYPD